MNPLYGLFLVLFLSEYAELPGNGRFYSQATRQGDPVTLESKVRFVLGMIGDNETKDNYNDCTAWFYNQEIVITAAHCVVDISYAYLIPATLRIEKDFKKQKHIKILPHQIEIHEDFIYNDNHRLSENDIAKIKLDLPVLIDEVQMPKVVGKDHKLTNFKSENLTIYGYGSEKLPCILKQCDVQYINDKTHEQKFHCEPNGGKKIMFTWPANGGDDYQHTLKGDSGAPILNAAGEVVATVIGVCKGLPDAFEPIAKHHDWIHREFKSNPYPKRLSSTRKDPCDSCCVS